MPVDNAFTQAGSFSAEVSRRAWYAHYARTSANTPGIIASGLVAAGDLTVSAPVSGLSVNVSVGECILGGSEGGAQGGYYARNAAVANLSISAASPSLPRVDTICMTQSDAGYTEPTGGSGSGAGLQVITGTPTSGASVTPGSGGYLAGVGSLPLSSLALAYVLVPTSATSIVSADVLNVATVVTLQFSQAAIAFSQLARGAGALQVVGKSAAYAATNGQLVVVTGGTPLTITLPAPVANGWVGVYAAAGSGASPVTVSAGSGIIYGVGLSAASSFPLGTVGAYAILQSDGTNWYIVAGQQDTGWVALSSYLNSATYTTISGSGGGTEYDFAGRVQGDAVRLRGVVNPGSGGAFGGPAFCTLPATFRPAHNVCLPVAIPALVGNSVLLTSAGAMTQQQSWNANEIGYFDTWLYSLS